MSDKKAKKRFDKMTMEKIEQLSREDLIAFMEQVNKGLDDHPEIRIPAELREQLKQGTEDLKQATAVERETRRDLEVVEERDSIRHARYDRFDDPVNLSDRQRGH